MDPLRLLSRSTKRSRGNQNVSAQLLPSNGTNAPITAGNPDLTVASSPSRKRKRGADVTSQAIIYSVPLGDTKANDSAGRTVTAESLPPPASAGQESKDQADLLPSPSEMTLEIRKAALRTNKLKVTWLSPHSKADVSKRNSNGRTNAEKSHPTKTHPSVYPYTLSSFRGLSSIYSVSAQLSGNVLGQGLDIPTEVQLAAVPLLLDDPKTYISSEMNSRANLAPGEVDLLTVAPTGSGKTLAFLIPLMHRLWLARGKATTSDRHTAAIILAPTRELAGQIVNEGRKLASGTGLKITQMRKGMRFALRSSTTQLPGADVSHGTSEFLVKSDIVVATPGLLQSALSDGERTANLKYVRHLVLDEADVLLDPLFRDQTLEIWNCLANPKLRVSLWSATMGSNIEELAMNTIRSRRERLLNSGVPEVPEAPVIRLVVGLKDSAVPNVQHKLIYAATEQGKLMGLRQLLHPTTNSVEAGPALRPPFLVFTQTIERSVALHAELLYDIPAEAGGIDRIAVLHADLSDTARDNVMTRFRKGEVWILITTDLLSRGVDFLGVNGVVNYDIPTSSAAYIHRIGRTGRAGRTGGVAITLYSKEDLPYLKHVANVVAIAKRNRGEELDDQWLLDALPKLNKNEKQQLKKRGVESRTARGKAKDPKAARKTQISSKSGYDRRFENRRKGAIDGSKRAVQAATVNDFDAGDETDFGGFD